MSGSQATWQPKGSNTATQLIEEAINVAYNRPVNTFHLDLTRRLRRKTTAKRKQVTLEYQPREVLDPTTTNVWQGRRQRRTEHMQGRANQSEIKETADNKRSFQAHSDNLEEFIEKFTFPQWMDTDARPELDLTSAFEKIGQVSVENSIADFTKWTKEKRAS